MNYILGQSKIEIFSSCLEKEKRQNLIEMYNVVNEIADLKRSNKINVDDWFYKPEELSVMQRDGDYEFI